MGNYTLNIHKFLVCIALNFIKFKMFVNRLLMRNQDIDKTFQFKFPDFPELLSLTFQSEFL